MAFIVTFIINSSYIRINKPNNDLISVLFVCHIPQFNVTNVTKSVLIYEILDAIFIEIKIYQKNPLTTHNHKNKLAE